MVLSRPTEYGKIGKIFRRNTSSRSFLFRRNTSSRSFSNLRLQDIMPTCITCIFMLSISRKAVGSGVINRNNFGATCWVSIYVNPSFPAHVQCICQFVAVGTIQCMLRQPRNSSPIPSVTGNWNQGLCWLTNALVVDQCGWSVEWHVDVVLSRDDFAGFSPADYAKPKTWWI